jgi:hypothetical protein
MSTCSDARAPCLNAAQGMMLCRDRHHEMAAADSFCTGYVRTGNRRSSILRPGKAGEPTGFGPPPGGNASAHLVGRAGADGAGPTGRDVAAARASPWRIAGETLKISGTESTPVIFNSSDQLAQSLRKGARMPYPTNYAIERRSAPRSTYRISVAIDLLLGARETNR